MSTGDAQGNTACPQGEVLSPRGHQAMSGDVFGCHTWGTGSVPLAPLWWSPLPGGCSVSCRARDTPSPREELAAGGAWLPRHALSGGFPQIRNGVQRLYSQKINKCRNPRRQRDKGVNHLWSSLPE